VPGARSSRLKRNGAVILPYRARAPKEKWALKQVQADGWRKPSLLLAGRSLDEAGGQPSIQSRKKASFASRSVATGTSKPGPLTEVPPVVPIRVIGMPAAWIVSATALVTT